jgi:hypothetical protein
MNIRFLFCGVCSYLLSPIDAGLYIIGNVVGVALNSPVQSSHACVLQSPYGEECIGWYSAFVLINHLLTRCVHSQLVKHWERTGHAPFLPYIDHTVTLTDVM